MVDSFSKWCEVAITRSINATNTIDVEIGSPDMAYPIKLLMYPIQIGRFRSLRRERHNSHNNSTIPPEFKWSGGEVCTNCKERANH